MSSKVAAVVTATSFQSLVSIELVQLKTNTRVPARGRSPAGYCHSDARAASSLIWRRC